MDYKEWYDAVYSDLVGAGLWLRGGELNTLAESEWERRAFRVMFARLSTYFDTGNSFAHGLLYQIAANTEGVFPDLAYLPPRSDAEIFKRDNVPWLIGTQTKKSAQNFDLVGFSNSIVQEILNLPTFLRESGIPLSKKERMARTDLPLVILGGANALYTSSLWINDPPIDGVFVGENDAAIRQILEIARDGKAAGLSKSEILNNMEGADGFFQPDNSRFAVSRPAEKNNIAEKSIIVQKNIITRKNIIKDFDKCETLERVPVSYIDEQIGDGHLQISEGCRCFCSFCAESWDRKPYREIAAKTLVDNALKIKAAMGLDRVSIYSFNFNMHSEFYRFLWDLTPHFRRVGLNSQRFDLLAQDSMMAEFQHAADKSSITCGLEGISPRLRKYLHKNLDDDKLYKSLSAIFRSKARELKIFTVATGLENDEDFAAFGETVKRLKEIKQAAQSGTRVIFSMTPLVRFPWTPLEFEDGYSTAHYAKIIKKSSGRVKSAGFEFRESADVYEYWVSQILTRARDPRIFTAMINALDTTGFVYYREIYEEFTLALRESLTSVGLDPDELIKGHTFEESYEMPWAKIDVGVDRSFLFEQATRARNFCEIDYDVPACLPREYNLAQFKERVKTARQSEVSVRLFVRVETKGVGVTRKMVGAAIARAIMLAEPSLAPHYRGYVDSEICTTDFPCYISGDDIITLRFAKNGLQLLEECLNDNDHLARMNNELDGWAVLFGVAKDNFAIKHFTFTSEFVFDPAAYLKELGLKHILRKTENGRYRCELIPQSVKKGYLKSIEYGKTEDGKIYHVTVEPSIKFDPVKFARTCFAFNKPSDWVRIKIAASRTDFVG